MTQSQLEDNTAIFLYCHKLAQLGYNNTWVHPPAFRSPRFNLSLAQAWSTFSFLNTGRCGQGGQVFFEQRQSTLPPLYLDENCSCFYYIRDRRSRICQNSLPSHLLPARRNCCALAFKPQCFEVVFFFLFGHSHDVFFLQRSLAEIFLEPAVGSCFQKQWSKNWFADMWTGK